MDLPIDDSCLFAAVNLESCRCVEVCSIGSSGDSLSASCDLFDRFARDFCQFDSLQTAGDASAYRSGCSRGQWINGQAAKGLETGSEMGQAVTMMI